MRIKWDYKWKLFVKSKFYKLRSFSSAPRAFLSEPSTSITGSFPNSLPSQTRFFFFAIPRKCLKFPASLILLWFIYLINKCLLSTSPYSRLLFKYHLLSEAYNVYSELRSAASGTPNLPSPALFFFPLPLWQNTIFTHCLFSSHPFPIEFECHLGRDLCFVFWCLPGI